MIIEYQITLEDFMALQKDLIKNTVYHKRRQKLAFILTELTVFFLGFTFAALFLPQTISLAVFCTLAIVAGILLALLLTPFIKKIYTPITLWQYRLLLGKDRSWPRIITLHFNETGIDFSSVHNKVKGNIQVDWESIEKVNEDEKRFFVYVEESEAFVIPKSNHNLSDAEQRMIRSMLKN